MENDARAYEATKLLQIVPLVKALSVGLPEDNASITPVISESSAKFIEELAMDAKAKGATFLTV